MSPRNHECAHTTVPVSVITGFLGSGKTTLLSRLLRDERMKDAAVIINEFGEIALDHVLVASPREDVLLLSSGCLCCSLRGDLLNTLTGLWNDRARGKIPLFNRVLVETTGLADPAPVLLTVTSDERLSEVFHLERIITTADAMHGMSELDTHPESVKQACIADALLLTKTDIAARSQLTALRNRLRRLNPLAFTQDVVHGEIDPDLLFNFEKPSIARANELDSLLSASERIEHGHSEHDAGPYNEGKHKHSHEADRHRGIASFVVVLDKKVTFHGLQLWTELLREIKGSSLLRIKGIVNVAGRPIVLQAVQHMFYPLSELPEWPGEDRRSRIVFITRDMPREKIDRTLDVLSLEPAPKRDNTRIDPDAFRQFVNAAGKFR